MATPPPEASVDILATATEWLQIASWLLTHPLGELDGVPDAVPSALALAGGLFWLVMAGVSWWLVGLRTADADKEGAPIALRLTALGLRILSSALCLLLSLDIFTLVRGRDIIAGIQTVYATRLFHIGDADVHVNSLILIVAVIVGTLWGSSALSAVTIKALSDRGVDTDGTVGVLLNLGRYLVIVIGLMVAISSAGIDLTALFTVGAVFAVTIGFALQSITQNFVSGVILLVEGAITPGDVLEVEGRVVRVAKMGIRSTVVRSMDDEDLILPNAVLAGSTVKNLTMADANLRVAARVSVSYGSDLDRVKGILEQAGRRVVLRARDREPVVLLQTFGDSGIDFDVFVWIHDPWIAPRARSQLRLSIWRALRDHDVVIPFPQVDLHVKEPVGWVDAPSSRVS